MGAGSSGHLGKRPVWLEYPCEVISHLVWPATCLNCRALRGPGSPWLCQDCWQDLLAWTAGDACPRCGVDASCYALVDGSCPNCLGHQIQWNGICRCGAYGGVLRELIIAFKWGRTELDMLLAALATSALEGQDWYHRIDLFVPVPLHWIRRLCRGYNQAAVIARRLRHPRAKVASVLVRRSRTAPQTSMPSHAARLRNVEGAFALTRPVRGKVVCLVDDVKTTGATLGQCAGLLKAGGARGVYALVIAVA